MFFKKSALALIVGVSILATGNALAQTPAASVTTTTGQTLGNPPFTLGWEFTAQSAINVTQLGLFDSDQDGLAESHDLGLWDSGGNLLASATIGAGTGATLLDKFRYVNVASVLLTAGQNYFVGGLYTSGADPLIFPSTGSGQTFAAEIAYLRATFVSGGALMQPTATGGMEGYFGPNFTYSNAIPEPATWALLIGGFALTGAAVRRRKAAERLAIA